MSKSEVLTFTWFFGHCTAKNIYIAIKFRMCVVCMQVNDVSSDNFKMFDFMGNYLLKVQILRFGVKIKNIKI